MFLLKLKMLLNALRFCYGLQLIKSRRIKVFGLIVVFFVVYFEQTFYVYLLKIKGNAQSNPFV